MSVETADTMPVTTQPKATTATIKHIIALCGFPDDSSMVEIIQQLEWMDLTEMKLHLMFIRSTRKLPSMPQAPQLHSGTAAQLSGDTLLKYINSARFPGNWRGISYAFILHWREQMSHDEKLELENVPPKQKLRMLKNTVSDVTNLSHIKQ
jgi:hypothetical protein